MGDQQHAEEGDVLRDHTGVWQHCFLCNSGSCDVISAELWAVRYGLQLAWDKGCKSLILEIHWKDVHCLLLDVKGKG